MYTPSTKMLGYIFICPPKQPQHTMGAAKKKKKKKKQVEQTVDPTVKVEETWWTHFYTGKVYHCPISESKR